MATATRATLPLPVHHERTTIQVLDNPLAAQDASLAVAVEKTLHEVLDAEDLGLLEVRVRVCREAGEGEGLLFICKVENPPAAHIDQGPPMPVRWWSPLMESVQDLRSVLQEALRLRRERARMATLPAF